LPNTPFCAPHEREHSDGRGLYASPMRGLVVLLVGVALMGCMAKPVAVVHVPIPDGSTTRPAWLAADVPADVADALARLLTLRDLSNRNESYDPAQLAPLLQKLLAYPSDSCTLEMISPPRGSGQKEERYTEVTRHIPALGVSVHYRRDEFAGVGRADGAGC
jgi:hypothetical protein